MTQTNNQGFSIPLYRGPFQNNGASPWYCEMSIGTPPQPLKFSIDTGSNFNWVTSSLCGDHGCPHYAEGFFIYQNSDTITGPSKHVETVSFGPWGTLDAQLAKDKLWLGQNSTCSSFFTNWYLAKKFNGQQFEELDWDGGIGLPSGQVACETTKKTAAFRLHHHSGEEPHPPEFDFYLQLVRKGLVNRDLPFIAVDTQAERKPCPKGRIAFSQLDDRYADSREYLFLPYSPYHEGAEYLWSTANASIEVGNVTLGRDMFFALDTGSSQFKGDLDVLTQVFEHTQHSDQTVTIALRDANQEVYGQLVIDSDLYKVTIEEGKDKGQTLAQFQGMQDADAMLLVGSVLMDHLYTVYEFDSVTDTETKPKGMWIFNKPGGPKIIQSVQSSPAALFTR